MCILVQARKMDGYMGVVVVPLSVTFWGNNVDFVPKSSVRSCIKIAKFVICLKVCNSEIVKV